MLKFKIKNTQGKARAGIIETAHGKVATPNIATVATHGEIRFFDELSHSQAKPELLIANTFHLWVRKRVAEIKKGGGLNKWGKFNVPTMTDSGGFQVFSLGWGKMHQIGKIAKGEKVVLNKKFNNPVKISDKGVIFEYDNKKFELTPELSMKIQNNIGADMIFTFDEPTSPYQSHTYNKSALKRTHDWAKRCLKEFNKLNKNKKQNLFGIVQGGVYEDLRKQSSQFIGALDFDGFGIGGSYGEKEMGEIISWAVSGLPENKPRHLLGVGKVRDIFIGVKNGIDLFDCVIPTREGRHGRIYTKQGAINITASKYAKHPLHKLFKKDPNRAKQKAVIHNIKFYKTLFKEIRQALSRGESLAKLERQYKKV